MQKRETLVGGGDADRWTAGSQGVCIYFGSYVSGHVFKEAPHPSHAECMSQISCQSPCAKLRFDTLTSTENNSPTSSEKRPKQDDGEGRCCEATSIDVDNGHKTSSIT
jgi:hypothetical protein